MSPTLRTRKLWLDGVVSTVDSGLSLRELLRRGRDIKTVDRVFESPSRIWIEDEKRPARRGEVAR